MKTHSPVRGVLCAAVLMAAPLAARADFTNFGDFSSFTYNHNDTGSAPTYALNAIHITNPASEDRSIFYNTPQLITGPFTAKFSYVCQNSYYFMGTAFVLENSPSGAGALGNSLGYSGMTGKSLAITLEGNGGGTFLSGFYTNGSLGSGSASTSPVGIQLGHLITATLTYDGTFLHENLLDTVTSATYDVSYLQNLPSILGSNTAYVGLTTTSYANYPSSGQDQTFSNFSFTTAVPEPASLGILASGALLMLSRRKKRQ